MAARALGDENTDIAEIAAALRVTKQAVRKRSSNWSYSDTPHPGNSLRLFVLNELSEKIIVAVLHYRAANQPKPEAPTDDEASPALKREVVGEYDPDALWFTYQRLSKKQKEVANAKHAVFVAAITAHEKNGVPINNAIKAAAEESRWSYATMRDLYYGKPAKSGLRDYARRDWLAALAPRHKGRTALANCHPKAFEHFKRDYLRLEKPTAESCFNNLKKVASKEGWTIPNDVRPLLRRIEHEVARPVIIMRREGIDALNRMYPPQRRERTHFHAMEAVNADGHRFDVFVKWPDGTVARPMMVAWQDLRSGKILSWRIDRSENSDLYRLSFADLMREWGIPRKAWFDNGRAIASKALTGGTPNRYRFKVTSTDPVGIITQILGNDNVHWTTPGHGQAKPIERSFGDTCTEYIAKDPRCTGAYTGNKPDAKPENYGSRAVPLEEFAQIVDSHIRQANARRGRRGYGLEGRSFDEVFDESYQANAHRIPRPVESQLTQFLLCAERIVADKRSGEIRLLGNRYWSMDLNALVDRPQAARTVMVYFDPDHLDRPVVVHSLEGRFLARASIRGDVRFDDKAAARSHAADKKRHRKHARALSAVQVPMSVDQVAESLRQADETSEKETVTSRKVVRAAFPKQPRPTRDREAEALAADRNLARALAPFVAKFRAESPDTPPDGDDDDE